VALKHEPGTRLHLSHHAHTPYLDKANYIKASLAAMLVCVTSLITCLPSRVQAEAGDGVERGSAAAYVASAASVLPECCSSAKKTKR
jgi:hypothetical protein